MGSRRQLVAGGREGMSFVFIEDLKSSFTSHVLSRVVSAFNHIHARVCTGINSRGSP